MKKLIIAEKPSLCRTIVSAVPEHAEKREGYYESPGTCGKKRRVL